MWKTIQLVTSFMMLKMNQMKYSPIFRTRAEIAQELGISTKTLGVMIKEANIEIPPRKLITPSQYRAILQIVE